MTLKTSLIQNTRNGNAKVEVGPGIFFWHFPWYFSSTSTLCARIRGFLLTDEAQLRVASGVVPSVPRFQLLNAIFLDPVDEEETPVVWHAGHPMAVRRLAVQPAEVVPIFAGADPPAATPLGEYFADFAENFDDFWPFRIRFDVLLDETVNGVTLRLHQFRSFRLALLTRLSEGLVVFGEPEANVAGSRDVMHGTSSTFLYLGDHIS